MGNILRTGSCKIAGGGQARIASANNDHIVKMRFSRPRALWGYICFALEPRYNPRGGCPGVAVASLAIHDVARRNYRSLGGLWVTGQNEITKFVSLDQQ